MSEHRVLDLFCGLGGFSQAFAESERWDVTTVDIEDRFDTDIRADVFDLRPSDFDGAVDVVLASPPCTQFSLAASRFERVVDGEPQTDAAADAVALVYHTIGLIRGLSPSYWLLENPQGYLRQFLGEPTGRVTFCQYGTDWMKPTDLWGTHPPGLSYRACSYGESCHVDNTDQEHGGLGNCNVSGTRDAAERAKVPYDLSAAIRDAAERALDGEVAEQQTLGEVTAP